MRTLLLLLGIYILYRLVSRYLMLRRFIRDQFEQQQGGQPRGKEGEVHIIDKRSTQQGGREGEGEYVDYEEL